MRIALSLLSLALVSTSASAQFYNKLTGFVGGGINNPVNDTSDRAKTGWNVVAGAGYRFVPALSLGLDFSYQSHEVDLLRTVDQQGRPIEGNLGLWSLTLNPRVEAGTLGPVSVYFTGGYGLYHRRIEVTRADIGTQFVCDYFYGFCYDALVPVDVILRERSVLGHGFNGGMGISFGTPRVKFFAEARYHRMFNGRQDVETVPVSFGVRW